MAKEFDVGIKITTDSADAVNGIDEVVESLDSFEKKAKKLGRELSTLITAPLAALAAISLKEVFDVGAIQGSTGKMREFAIAIERVKSTFNAFILDIGNRIAPAAIRLANLLTNMMRAFKELDNGAKNTIIVFGAIAAAMGPLILAVSSVISLFVKLAPIFKTIGGFATTIAKGFSITATAIAGLVLWVTSLGSTFVYLKKAGLDTIDALQLALTAWVRGFNAKVIAPIANGLSGLIGRIASLSSTLAPSLSKGLKDASVSIGNFGKDLEARFESTKKDLNEALKPIGASADDALTAGLSSGFEKFKNKLKEAFSTATAGATDGVLQSEVGKNLERTNQEIEALNLKHKINLEQAELEHQFNIKSIANGNDRTAILQERFDKESELLERNYKLQLDALDRQVNNELLATDAITNINERRVAQKEILEKDSIARTALIQDQEIERTKLRNDLLLQIEQERYNKILPYAQAFSQGLTSSFMSIMDGTKSLGRAFEDFARDFVKQVTQMIIQQTILNSVMGRFGFATGGPVQAFATGGPVRGAGSGTSDSIPAWLSNGEYVMDAKTVRTFGNDFFMGLQSMAKGGVPFSMPSALPKFADGGMVSSPGQAPQIVIENSGSEKRVASSEYDPKTAITTIILEDLGRNGPVSKGLQSTFGMKRGGFA